MKPHGPVESPRRVLRTALCHAAICLACLLVYGQILRFGLTCFDDQQLLGALKERPVSLLDVFNNDPYLLKSGAVFYRPLQTLTYLADLQFGANDASACHGTNLLLFTLACCTLFTLLRRLGYGAGVALVSVLVYSFNPLFTQVVAWIPARGDLLLMLFALASFIALIRWREEAAPRFLALHVAAFLLALLSKETAVMLPAVFSVYIALQGGAGRLLSRRNAALLFSWSVLVGLYLMLRRTAIGAGPGPDVFGLRSFLGNLPTIPETLSNFVWPLELSVMPSFTSFRTITGVILIAVVAVRVATQREKRRAPMLFGTAWFLILSTPGMLVSPEIGIHAFSYLNHRTFLPMVGALIVFLELAPGTWRVSPPRALYAAGLTLAGVLAVLSLRYGRVFADRWAFHDQAVRTNPQSVLALCSRGDVRDNSGDFRGAVQDYSQALRIVPNYFPAHLNRGLVMRKLGDYPSALADLTAALRDASAPAGNRTQRQALPANGEAARALYNRGCIRYDRGDLRGAVEDYSAALQVAPGDFSAEVGLNRGVALAQLGDYPAAIADMTAAILSESSSAENRTKAYLNRATFKALSGDQAGALEDFDEAVRSAPEHAEAYEGRGEQRRKMGDADGALRDLTRAVELNPGLPDPLFTIGLMKHERGDETGARAAWQAAAELGHAGAQEKLR